MVWKQVHYKLFFTQVLSHLSSFILSSQFFVSILWVICDWVIRQATDKKSIIFSKMKHFHVGTNSYILHSPSVIKLFLEKILVNLYHYFVDEVMKDTDNEHWSTIDMAGKLSIKYLYFSHYKCSSSHTDSWHSLINHQIIAVCINIRGGTKRNIVGCSQL